MGRSHSQRDGHFSENSLPEALEPVNRVTTPGRHLLTALSRSRHFGLTESGIGDDFSPWSATCRSLFSRQRTGPPARTVANPSDCMPFRRETPRRESRGFC